MLAFLQAYENERFTSLISKNTSPSALSRAATVSRTVGASTAPVSWRDKLVFQMVNLSQRELLKGKSAFSFDASKMTTVIAE